jgi:aldose 1-epimerase
MRPDLGISDFGMATGDTPVHRITIGSDELRVSVLDWGAILQGVWMTGLDRNLTLGSETLADYLPQMRSMGALIAPVVNRIAGAQAMIAGRLHRFAANQAERITLHSGPEAATHLRRWRIEQVAPDRATLAVDLPDGQGGFPGNRRVSAEFRVTGAALRMTVTATTDAPTLFNAANHSYWNLDGSETFAGHRLKIAAESYLPTDADFVPTGEIRAVAGTPMDFRREVEVAPGQPPLDHNFCLSMGQTHLRDVLWLTGRTGVALTMATTESGMQVYDGRNARRPGHAAYEGLAFEAQSWPDAPNHPGFPSILLSPGEPRVQVTEWRFARR